MNSGQRRLLDCVELPKWLDSYHEAISESEDYDKAEANLETLQAFEDNLQDMTKEDALAAMWSLIGTILDDKPPTDKAAYFSDAVFSINMLKLSTMQRMKLSDAVQHCMDKEYREIKEDIEGWEEDYANQVRHGHRKADAPPSEAYLHMCGWRDAAAQISRTVQQYRHVIDEQERKSGKAVL